VSGGRRTCHEQGSEAVRGVQYEGEKCGSREADRWDRPGCRPRLSVKEREREEYDRWARVDQIEFELFQTYSNLTCSKEDLPEVENFEIKYG
jgi:hypothetical protein